MLKSDLLSFYLTKFCTSGANELNGFEPTIFPRKPLWFHLIGLQHKFQNKSIFPCGRLIIPGPSSGPSWPYGKIGTESTSCTVLFDLLCLLAVQRILKKCNFNHAKWVIRQYHLSVFIHCDLTWFSYFIVGDFVASSKVLLWYYFFGNIWIKNLRNWAKSLQEVKRWLISALLSTR